MGKGCFYGRVHGAPDKGEGERWLCIITPGGSLSSAMHCLGRGWGRAVLCEPMQQAQASVHAPWALHSIEITQLQFPAPALELVLTSSSQALGVAGSSISPCWDRQF